LFLHGNHPDFRLIQPVDKNGAVDRIGGTLRAEQAAEIIHDVALRPMEGRYKIFLIQDVHMANDSFANKLLKTLEEPPGHALFLLTALDRNRLLATIVSRCQLLELRPLAAQTIAQALVERWQVVPPEADLLARLARGRLGWALQQSKAETEQQVRLSQLQALWQLLEAPLGERLSTAEKLATTTNSQQLFELLETWGTWLRDVLLVQSGCAESCCNIDQRPELERQAQLISSKAVQHYLRTLHRIEGYLHHTINTRLALEVLLLQVPETGSRQ
jgi:DNA polymerase-3 subunit delta'